MHFNSGMIIANTSLSANNPDIKVPSQSIKTIPPADFMYETFRSNDMSFIIRYIFGFNTSNQKVQYTYGGLGQRYYVFSKGPVVSREEDGVNISSVPGWRFFWGWEAGLDLTIQGQAQTLFNFTVPFIEGGLTAGMSYAITQSTFVELSGSAAFGASFLVATGKGTILKALLGAGYHFE